MEPKLALRDPVHFRMQDVVKVNLFAAGVVLVLLGAMALVDVVVIVTFLGLRLAPLGFVIGLVLYIVMAVVLLPFTNNVYIARRVRRFVPRPDGDGETFLVQVALKPRVYGGLRGFLEDADDVGYLRFTEEGLEFVGDSIDVRLPFENINGIEDVNVGIRGFWVVGRRVRVSTAVLPPYSGLEFLEREALQISRSRRVTEAIIQSLMIRTRLSPR